MSHPTPRAALVLLAAGDGRRVGAETNKVLLPLAGRPVFTWSLRRASGVRAFVSAVLVVRAQDRDTVVLEITRHGDVPDIRVVDGGRTRHESEWHALQVLAPAIEAGEVDMVVIHDAARPLAPTELYAEVVAAAAEHGGAIPVRYQSALVALDPAGPAPPADVAAVQTPQAFRARPLLEAYRRAEVDGFTGTDTASCFARYTDLPVHAVLGGADNVKITFPEDVQLAERLLRASGRD